jgi:hypothetical protein
LSSYRGSSAYDAFNLAVVGKPAEFVFRENEFPVQHDFKDAAAGFDDLRIGAEFPLELVRQTGGSRPVVSHAAIGDGELHDFGPSASSESTLVGLTC